MVTIFAILLSLPMVMGGESLRGQYVVDFEKCTIDSTGKRHCYGEELEEQTWYDRYAIRFSGDSVFANTQPFYVTTQGDTTFSASDGGYYHYTGYVTEIHEGEFVLHLVEIRCDYCGVMTRINSKGELEIIPRRKSITLHVREGRYYFDNKPALQQGEWRD